METTTLTPDLLADDRLISIEEAGRMLSMSRSSLYNLMESGALNYHKIGKARRLRLAEVRRLIASTLVSREPLVAV